ncbi:SpaA isopeptide-forming pilin-related protein [Bacillus sp. JJ722]|uniref:SpaA isopeptide-forming pilin-related protein n=1 Tax=Bacillus sp. JJ722 TaxID=3122973 RepID=UPI002FFE67A3
MRKRYNSIISFMLTLLLVFSMVVPTAVAEGNEALDGGVTPTSMSNDEITTTPPSDGTTTTPGEETKSPGDGQAPTSEENPPPSGNEAPSDGETQPGEGEESSSEETIPPGDGETTGSDGEIPSDNAETPQPDVSSKPNPEDGTETPKPETETENKDPKPPVGQPKELDFNIITGITLNGEDNVDLTEKESIKKDSKVSLIFTYAIPTGKFVMEGDTFTFSIPEELKSLEGQFDLKGKDEDNNRISYGTGVVSGGQVKLTFSKNVEQDNVRGEFFFEAQFVEEKIGDENPVPIAFDLKGEATVIALDFEQKQKVNPTISKESIAFDKQTNIITWKVHIKSGDEDIKNVVFNDSIQEDQEYVAGSFKVGTASIDDAKVLGKDGKTLNYTFDSIAKESTKIITFETKIKDESLPSEDTEKTYKNIASIHPEGYEKPIMSNEVGVTVKTDNIQKTGKANKSSSGATTIDWTITINKDSNTIKNEDGSLKIEDTLQEGLKLVQDSVKILDGSQDVTSDSDLGSLKTRDDGFTFTFKKTVSKQYTITYTTDVTDQDFLITGKDQIFTNTATLTGTDVINGSATANVGVGVKPNRISKSGTYDRSSKEITWTISINNDGVPLKNVILTDKIEEGQTLVKGSLSNDKCTYDENSKIITCDLGDINEKQTITFKTTVDSNNDHATNNQSTYYNTATIEHDGITDSTDKVPVQVTSNVIKKAVAESYNYEDRTITWKLTINENNMSLTDIEVRDTIPDGFEYVEGSAKTSIVDIGTFSSQDRTLVFTANKDQVIKEQFDITFITKVSKPDEFFKTNGEIYVTNTATIKADEIPGTVTSNEASTDIQNNIVSKDGNINKDAKSITWQVEVNPNYINLPKNVTIKDTLQEGLELDVDSVKLYSAKVDSKTGALTKGAEVALEAGSIQYDGKTRQFDFTFPDIATSVPSAYILVFDTDVMKEGTYTNSVTFNGTGSDLTDQSTSQVIDQAIMGGTGTGNTRTISMEKVDKDTKQKLSGAEFELWMDHPRTGKTFVRTVSSDSEGQVSFDRLRSGIKYTVKEVKAPEGYQLSSTLFEFTLDSKEKHPNETKSYSFENERIKGAVQFMKKGKDGQPLSGAEFKLYYKADTTFELPVGQAISDQNGMVTFENVPLGEYVIKETKAPAGYNLSEQVLNVKVTKESAQGVTKAQPYEMINERTKGSIQFIKTNELGKPLAGAEFELYAEDNSKVGSAVTSNEDGLVEFKDVEHGVYTIKESKAPKGYQLLSKPLIVTVDGKEGQIYKLEDVKNYKIIVPPPTPPQGDVKVLKTDENGTPLAGAELTLYASDGKEVARSISDATGIVMFKSIPFGNYTLKETKAPSGYIKSDEILSVTIKDSVMYEFTFINKKEDNPINPGPDPGPNPGPNPGPEPGKNPGPNPGTDIENNNEGIKDSNSIPNDTKTNQGTLPETGGDYYNYLLISSVIGIIGGLLIVVERYRRKSRA